MSTVIAKNVQVGTSGTSTDNFTIFQPATPDGTLRIGNGNTGITTSQVALTSAGNVGIGTSSPASQLDVSKTGDAILSVTSAGVQRYQLITRSGGNFEVYDQSSAATRIAVTQAGNLGLGVTPSAWANYRAFQVGAQGALAYNSGITILSTNWYEDSGSSPRYIGTGNATQYYQASGAHVWRTAASGTAGNAITFSESMRLDSSSNLQFNSGYGSVATAYGCRAWVNFNGTGTVAIRASGNVSSITDNGTGDYTVNFTTAMPDINYSMVGCSYWAGSDVLVPSLYETGLTARTVSSIRIRTTYIFSGITLYDGAFNNVSIFR